MRGLNQGREREAKDKLAKRKNTTKESGWGKEGEEESEARKTV